MTYTPLFFYQLFTGKEIYFPSQCFKDILTFNPLLLGMHCEESDLELILE